MANDNSDSARRSGATAAIPSEPRDSAQLACVFTESGSVTLAALLNLLRLMGSELVLNRGNCEAERLEHAVRSKIGQFLSPTADKAARDAGLAHATQLVEQVMAQIRAQAQLQKSITSSRRSTRLEPAPALHLSRLLN